ncbi:MAG: ATPase domain-containing protein [Candidatus Micrarchaeia archaeon]
MQRVKTGIAKLDDLLEGGFPKNSVILVSGTPGAGKTIFSLQFIVEGARSGERGLYITFEQIANSIRMQALQFGWDLEKYEKDNLVRVVSLKTLHSHVEKVICEVEELTKKFNAQRLVLDSLSTLAIYSEVAADVETFEMMGIKTEAFIPPIIGDVVTRRAVMNLIERIRALEVTTILTSELQAGSAWLSRDTVSEFACDGVIKLQKIEALGKRTLTVEKMRGTKHDFLPRMIVIGPNGIEIEDGTK